MHASTPVLSTWLSAWHQKSVERKADKESDSGQLRRERVSQCEAF